MKKYAIIIGENNEELSKRVQEALFAVGFLWVNEDEPEVELLNGKILCLNTFDDGCISYRDCIGGGFDNKELLWPSYVIENAHKLDGAKEPWQIPPEGYRLVTESERKEFEAPQIKMKFFYDNERWCKCGGSPHVDWLSNLKLAVPLGTTFTKPEAEIMVGGKPYSESTIKNALKAYVA